MGYVRLAPARRARRGAPRLRARARRVHRARLLAASRCARTASSRPLERGVYRVLGVTPESEQRWTVYARSVLAFSAVSVLGLYLLQRVQGALFLNPTDVADVPPALAFNTAVSFVTNTNWQNYGGESTMSHLTQMSGLAVQNFVSAAVGMAVAIALVRGITRRRSETIGNFWVDLTRSVTRILLPLAVVLALVLVARGAIQTLRRLHRGAHARGRDAGDPRRARSRARRRSRSSARTAAARSTRTRRTRSRTRRRSRTCSRSSRCS